MLSMDMHRHEWETLGPLVGRTCGRKTSLAVADLMLITGWYASGMLTYVGILLNGRG